MAVKNGYLSFEAPKYDFFPRPGALSLLAHATPLFLKIGLLFFVQ